MTPRGGSAPREALSRDRVLATAVATADRRGLEAVSMRQLAKELGVVPMALYRHVASKDELLDGMVDRVIGEIAAPETGLPWRGTLRSRILSARSTLLRHPWARRVMESKTVPTPIVLGYLNSTIGVQLAGGLSVDLTHHAMHALGSRIFGFTQELYNNSQDAEPIPDEAVEQLAQAFPAIAAIAVSRDHDGSSVVGSGCDDQFEFEFALDVVLDGIERLHRIGWTSSMAATSAAAATEC